MSLEAQTFIKRFESYCPQWLAEKGDPVGLHIGTLDKKIERVMVTLDVRPEIVAEAIEKKIDLIVAKHPPIFRSIKRLITDDPQIDMYAQLLQHHIAVYVAHTNLDIVEDGLNDWFCEALGIHQTTYLTNTHTIRYKKLVVFVPFSEATVMRKVLVESGARLQGEYVNTHDSIFNTGRFTPLRTSSPEIDETFQEQAMQETKIEVIFPETIQEKVIKAMSDVHPYQKPVYDVYCVEHVTKNYGIGRIGYLVEKIPLMTFVEKVKEVFRLDCLKLITTNEKQMVQRIAICGGSGEKFFRDALKKEADVYLTGDVYYHTGHDMLTEKLTVIDPGHYIEELCKVKLVNMFDQWKEQENWDITFISSEISTNPFKFY